MVHHSGASTESLGTHSRGIEPSLRGAIREGFLEEVRLKLTVNERIGVC